MPREHELKIRQTPLADLLSGLKTGEVRDCSDREFAVGDTVLLREIDDASDYTGTVLRRTITHVQKNYGLPDHLCVLSYGQPAPQPHPEPIAWMVGTAIWWTKEEAERDSVATGLPVVGVGPMSGIAPADQHHGKSLTFTESSLAAALEKVQSLHELGCGLIAEAVFQQLAGQRQGVPVALPSCNAKLSDSHDWDQGYRDGWRACLDEIAKLGPLYTHADPGEVERLRAALKFYADRDHFAEDIGSDGDSVSGEPANVLWHEQEAWFVEDGSIARAALERQP